MSLQRRVAGSPQKTPSGAPDKAWSELAEVWADVRPLRGNALFLAQQAQSKVIAEIEIRWSSVVSGVSAEYRVVHGSTVYNIEAVINPDARNQRLLLRCSTGTNQG